MRDEVCIILNEREPPKKRAVDQLIERLAAAGISASRMTPSAELGEIIAVNPPRVLVLDYLLGDFTTGLDLLEKLGRLDEARRPGTFFLTDEPSVQAAVDALRLGAAHWLELGNPQAVEILACEIRARLAAAPERSTRRLITRRLDNLVAAAPASQELIQRAKILAARRVPLVIIHGPSGSGLTALAEALQLELTQSQVYRRIDLAVSNFSAAEILDWDHTGSGGFGSGCDFSLIIERAEEDDGALIEIMAREHSRIFSADRGAAAFVIVSTACPQTARAWQRLTQAELLPVPPLAVRSEDIPALTQLFVRESEALCHKKIPPFKPGVLEWICRQAWPQNVKQLRAAVTDAAISATFCDEPIEQLLAAARRHWEALPGDTPIDDSSAGKLTAALVVADCGWNFRIAAARMGISQPALRRLLMPANSGTQP